ncbi:hypothetical protein PV379_03995 [Streptomyces caniscabiei]|uniref:hypothetical protein n=1 Tax=Streptomyces caniscabiei TaxID=2746961 RepID=UPI0029BE94E6|nr:hypothetical protein [Streptomyces caniscabiei]MDX2776501.1 hypothetical protein [Streptomyces caniscabiei]
MPNAIYEYEERAFLNEEQFLPIKEKLDSLAMHHEVDNKTSSFFVLPDVNVSIASSPTKTVIKYKGGQLGLGNGFEEIEIPIEQSSLSDSIKLFSTLLKTEPQVSEQFRINYTLPSDIEIALKYTQTWGFHLEAEKTYEHTESLENVEQQAKEDLDALAKKLGISYIDDATMDVSKRAWAAGEQFGAYSPDSFREKYGEYFHV